MINWLTNDAVSNYIVFIMGLIAGLVAEIIRTRLQKRKPSIIEVRKEKETSLISVSPEARKRLQITYSHKEARLINELQQVTLRVENIGEQPVQNVEIGVVLEDADSDNLLEIIVEDPLWNSRESKTDLRYTPDGDLGIWICASFVNPYKEYQDTLEIQIYSSKAINIKHAVGGGLGWSVSYFDKVAYRADVEAEFAKLPKSLSYLLWFYRLKAG